MVGWHHRLSGHEFEQAPRESEGQAKPGLLQSMGSQRVRDKGTEQPPNSSSAEWAQPHLNCGDWSPLGTRVLHVVSF